MTTSSAQIYQFGYIGSFPLCDNLYQNYDNGSNSKGLINKSSDLLHRSIEECLIDSAEVALINDEISRDDANASDSIELQIGSNSVQLFCRGSEYPFERLPLHKIKHIVAYEDGRPAEAKNVLLVENFAYSNHRGPISKCHLFQSQCTQTVDTFCREFQQKLDEIQAKVLQQQK